MAVACLKTAQAPATIPASVEPETGRDARSSRHPCDRLPQTAGRYVRNRKSRRSGGKEVRLTLLTRSRNFVGAISDSALRRPLDHARQNNPQPQHLGPICREPPLPTPCREHQRRTCAPAERTRRTSSRRFAPRLLSDWIASTATRTCATSFAGRAYCRVLILPPLRPANRNCPVALPAALT
jgi:hypothetical protein